MASTLSIGSKRCSLALAALDTCGFAATFAQPLTDGSGFVRRSKTFEGNVTEGPTLQVMLTGLKAPAGALVIMDAGIATEANIDWLIENKYRSPSHRTHGRGACHRLCGSGHCG